MWQLHQLLRKYSNLAALNNIQTASTKQPHITLSGPINCIKFVLHSINKTATTSETMTELVRGEASESEEEMDVEKVFASEIPGEATESDEDLYEKNVASASPSAESLYRNNILQRKLIENNVAIYKGLGNFVKNFITAVSKQLLNMDQLLIKSQVAMQSALSSLKGAQANMKLLHEKSSDVFTMNFVPDISVHLQN